MVALEVLKKIRDDIVDKKIIVVSDNPNIDRINIVVALSDYILKEEELCKKRNKLTLD